MTKTPTLLINPIITCCGWCHRLFATKQPRHLYCSPRCAKAASRSGRLPPRLISLPIPFIRERMEMGHLPADIYIYRAADGSLNSLTKEEYGDKVMEMGRQPPDYSQHLEPVEPLP